MLFKPLLPFFLTGVLVLGCESNPSGSVAVQPPPDDTTAPPPDTSSGKISIGPRSYFVLPDDGQKVFPTYLAHLMGANLNGLQLRFADPIDIVNSSSIERTLTVEISVQGYSQPGAATVTLSPGETRRVDVQPSLDLHAMYELSAPTSAQVRVTVEEQGNPVTSETDTIILAPRNVVFWAAQMSDGSIADLRPFVTTFVTPADHDNAVQTLLTDAAHESPNGSMVGYQYEGKMHPPESWSSLAPGAYVEAEPLYRKGQTISVASSYTGCSNCDYYPVVALMSPTQCDAWANGGDFAAIFTSNVKEEGDSQRVIAPETGYYCLVVAHPGTAGTVGVRVQRSFGWDEGARIELSAIFDALHERGLVYVNVPGTFFNGAQNVKLPAQSLQTGSSNCIDGTLLFASALEALGMAPELVIVPGHAFVGVKAIPDTEFLEFIETTMVSGGDAEAALDYAADEFDDANANASTTPLVYPAVIDVLKARQYGITPMPF